MAEYESLRCNMKMKSDGTSSRGYEGSRKKLKSFAAASLLAAAMFLAPSFAYAATSDLSITQSQITFSQSTFYVGDVVRIYARVRNLGETDMTATVFFYQSDQLIAAAQPISLPAEGANEEVFVDFTVPSGSFNIRAVIQGADPADEDASNNEATTPLYTAIEDADRDGVEDDVDTCRTDSNADQQDADGDGAGDVCDTDDDGDGLSDSKESTVGTDPLVADTDEDGVNDKADASPLVAATPVAEPTVDEPRATSAGTNGESSHETATVTGASAQSDVSEDAGEDGVDAPTSAYGVLTTRDANGNEDTDTQEATASFFNLQNPWVQALLGFGVLLILALVAVLVVLRRHRNDEV